MELEKQFGPDAPLGSIDLANLDWLHRHERFHFISYLISLPREVRKDQGYFWYVTEVYGEIVETGWEGEWADYGLVYWLIQKYGGDEPPPD